MTHPAEDRGADDPAPQKGCPKVVGYARVSTDDQLTGLQEDALERAGVDLLCVEQAAGAIAARPVLAAVLESLEAGDTLTIWRLDRLGRSLADLLRIATDLRTRGVHLRSLTEGFDTGTSSGRLLFAVLGAVAEFEREALRERTVAGMAAAKRAGSVLGRPIALGGSRLEYVRDLLDAGNTKADVARLMRVSRSTIGRALAPRGAGAGVSRS